MKKYFALLLAFSLLYFSACKEKNTQPPAPTSANASGSVALYDEGTEPVNNSGMSVIIDGSDPEISVVTDNNGDWVFEDLAYGTYNLVFEKENYGTYKIFDLLHNNGSSFLTTVPSLGQKSTIEVTSLSQSQFEESILVNVECSPAASSSNTNYLRYFLGLTDSISNIQYMEFSQVFSADVDPVVITLTQQQLNDYGFSTGSTVYIRVYGDSYYSNNYLDPTGGQIFPNINSNAVAAISFVVP